MTLCLTLRPNGSRKVKRQRAVEVRASDCREPNRITQKEKSVYSLRQKNSSKIRPPNAQARGRSSRFLHSSAVGISSSVLLSRLTPGARGQASIIFQHKKPPKRDAVKTSAHAEDRLRQWINGSGRSMAAGYRLR